MLKKQVTQARNHVDSLLADVVQHESSGQVYWFKFKPFLHHDWFGTLT